MYFFLGKLIKRQRLPKNDQGDYWMWKDINLGQNVTFYGKVFHVLNCDKFTSVSSDKAVSFSVVDITTNSQEKVEHFWLCSI
jgi:hypothetical protein